MLKRIFSLLLLLAGSAANLPARAAEPMATLAIGDATTLEGNSKFRELLFPVTLSKAQVFDVSASFRTRDISAETSRDYLAHSGQQIVIKAGQTRTHILVRVVSDAFEERDESFMVQLGAPKRCGIRDSDGIGTIKDDDYHGQISISDVSLPEGDSGKSLAKTLIALTPAPLHPITLIYQTQSGSALADSDYLATQGSVTFGPNRARFTVAVPVLGDFETESDEKCVVKISAPGYKIAKNLGSVSLVNDDGLPVKLWVGGGWGIEGNGDAHDVKFSILLEKPAKQPFDLSYRTEDRSARAPDDYLGTSGTVRFETGQTQAEVVVSIVGDRVEEANETFEMVVSAPQGVIGGAVGSCYIYDDDYAGRISVADVSLSEGSGGSSVARVTISADPAPLHFLDIGFFTQNGTAISGADYAALPKNITFIPAGKTETSIDVIIFGDTEAERDETFTFQISGHNAIAKSAALITIINDDGPLPEPVEVWVEDGTATEGNSGTTHANFIVRLTRPAPRALEMRYQSFELSEVEDKTLVATAPDDFLASSGVVRFAVGETQATVSVPVVGDTVEEAEQYFGLQLSAPEGLLGYPQGVGIIEDDDYDGQILVTGATITEANGESQTARVQISLSRPCLHPVKFDYFTQDGTATAPGDYIARRGSSAIYPGATSLSLSVRIVGDLQTESDENLTFQFRIPTNGQQSFGTITILNDDKPPLPASGKIVFTSERDGNAEIYVMNGDGTQQTRLTSSADYDAMPFWSPDGSKIIWTSRVAGSDSEIWAMNADGSGKTQLTNNFYDDYTAGFSPDGSKIAFLTKPDIGDSEIAVMNADGSGARILTENYQDERSPSFSPDSQRLLFDSGSRYGGGGGDVLLKSINSSQIGIFSRLGSSSAIAPQPAFSLDGSQVGYVSNSSSSQLNSGEIYRVNLDGSGNTRLTTGAVAIGGPHFMPDGSRILFESNRDVNGELWSMKPDGSDLKRFTLSRSFGAFGCFSADATQLALVSSRSGSPDIYSLSLDGTGEVRLTSGGHNYQPSWAPGSVPAPPATPAAKAATSAGSS